VRHGRKGRLVLSNKLVQRWLVVLHLGQLGVIEREDFAMKAWVCHTPGDTMIVEGFGPPQEAATHQPGVQY